MRYKVQHSGRGRHQENTIIEAEKYIVRDGLVEFVNWDTDQSLGVAQALEKYVLVKAFSIYNMISIEPWEEYVEWHEENEEFSEEDFNLEEEEHERRISGQL